MPNKSENRKTRLRRSAPLGLALLASLILGACSKQEQEKEATVKVRVALVRRTTIARKVATEAILFPRNAASLVPKISAPVRKFYVNRGSRVRAGQLLALLENRDLAAAAQESQGAYDQARASYETITRASVPEEAQKADLDVKAARETLGAEQKLYDSRKMLYEQGALPRKDFDQAAVSLIQARNQYEIAQKHLEALESVGRQAELKAAAAQLESAKGKYLGAEAQLSYSEIRSPIDGVVTDRPLYEGEMAAAGSPLITVMDTSQVIAKAHISQQQAALLKVGDSANLYPPAPSGPAQESRDIEGKVTVLSPALDPNSTTVEIWIQAPNPGGRLKPGTTVGASILAETVPNALVIPASALLAAPGGSTTVMVVGSDGRAHQRGVRAGIREGSDVQIAEGLEALEWVVAVAAYGLPDNTKVEVETPKARDEAPVQRKGTWEDRS